MRSAVEPLLPNGTPPQLVSRPGNMKRGIPSLAEDSVMKRSRTSSVSSVSGVQALRGTPGTRRNPIQSSYSSSLGLGQWKKRSAASSPLSSPGSSRCQTPEGASKRPRGRRAVAERRGRREAGARRRRQDARCSGGKRKRKIQLVSSNRDDHISLPPPPELGYTVTVRDLDEEKRAALCQIQKVLETPAPEAETSAPPPAAATTQLGTPFISTSTSTLSGLLAAPLLAAPPPAAPSAAVAPPPGPGSAAPAASNPLLEALKMKIVLPSGATSAANGASGEVLKSGYEPLSHVEDV
ncbi:Nuclear envelope pore membrane protein POM 121 [Liparis tanakae]|uniref:Nuclear envelope pore membrane protein POM 121 n=1 Tax=Liparis tanakae TaxID=230148 RepID=A0A4Z2EWK1_9TELE|nr:Nuclear envelope pore membrane protein POM 121 [Liparis tanakae]